MPAVERPSVIGAQTRDQFLLGLLDLGRDLLQLLARGELGAQIRDLAMHAIVAAARVGRLLGVAVVLVEGRAEVAKKAIRIVLRLFVGGGLGSVGGQGGRQTLELRGLARPDTLQFGVDARLDLEFDVFGAR